MSMMAARGLRAFVCSVALTLAASVAHGQFPANPTYPQGGGYPPNGGYPQGGGYPPAGGDPQNGGYPQGGPGVIVGTWSTTLYDTRGQAFASIFIQFRPDGRYQKRMIVRGGTTDTFGSYRFDPQQSLLQYRAEDYAPKMNCDGPTCLPIPPVEPMGQVMTVQLQFTSPNLFVLQDASGPLRWVRQN